MITPCVPCVRVADSNSDKHYHTFYKTLTYWDHQAADTPIYDNIHFTQNQEKKMALFLLC
jgi:hypothetical protein